MPFVCLNIAFTYFMIGPNQDYKLRNVQSKNVVNNVDMSSLRAPWQNGPYINQHTEPHKNT